MGVLWRYPFVSWPHFQDSSLKREHNEKTPDRLGFVCHSSPLFCGQYLLNRLLSSPKAQNGDGLVAKLKGKLLPIFLDLSMPRMDSTF